MEQIVEFVQIPLSRLRDVIREENNLAFSKLFQPTIRDKPDKEWLTNSEAMTYLGMSRSSLQRLRAEGTLPFSKLGAGTIRYRKSDIDRFLESGFRVSSVDEVLR